MTIKVLSNYKNEIHTITADYGTEFAHHKRISSELGLISTFIRLITSRKVKLTKMQMYLSDNGYLRELIFLYSCIFLCWISILFKRICLFNTQRKNNSYNIKYLRYINIITIIMNILITKFLFFYKIRYKQRTKCLVPLFFRLINIYLRIGFSQLNIQLVINKKDCREIVFFVFTQMKEILSIISKRKTDSFWQCKNLHSMTTSFFTLLLHI